MADTNATTSPETSIEEDSLCGQFYTQCSCIDANEHLVPTFSIPCSCTDCLCTNTALVRLPPNLLHCPHPVPAPLCGYCSRSVHRVLPLYNISTEESPTEDHIRVIYPERDDDSDDKDGSDGLRRSVSQPMWWTSAQVIQALSAPYSVPTDSDLGE